MACARHNTSACFFTDGLDGLACPCGANATPSQRTSWTCFRRTTCSPGSGSPTRTDALSSAGIGTCGSPDVQNGGSTRTHIHTHTRQAKRAAKVGELARALKRRNSAAHLYACRHKATHDELSRPALASSWLQRTELDVCGVLRFSSTRQPPDSVTLRYIIKTPIQVFFSSTSLPVERYKGLRNGIVRLRSKLFTHAEKLGFEVNAAAHLER